MHETFGLSSWRGILFFLQLFLTKQTGKVSYERAQSRTPMPKPHDYAVLAVISTAHLTDNRICCLLYLPRGN